MKVTGTKVVQQTTHKTAKESEKLKKNDIKN